MAGTHSARLARSTTHRHFTTVEIGAMPRTRISTWSSCLGRLWREPRLRAFFVYTGSILLATVPTWNVYLWWGHSMLFPAVHVSEICKLWRADGFGQVAWCSDYCFGYGYPYFCLYGPLGFYVGALYHFVLGLDFGNAAKLSFYTSLYLSGAFMYAFAYLIGRREDWPRTPWWALAAATIYALTRYHFTDLFVRSALGECWAWTMLPGVFWGMELTRRHPLRGALLVSAAYAGLLLSHNITALWGSIFIAAYVPLTARDIRWPAAVAGGGALGIALAAFFWYPALILSKLTRHAGDVMTMWGSPQQIHTHAVYWQQHFMENLGYGNSIAGPDDSLGINLGFAVLIGTSLSALAVFRLGLTGYQRRRLASLLFVFGGLLFIMSPQMSWSVVPALFRYIQFPWRLLVFTAFFGAAATAMASPVLDRWIHPGVLVGLAILFSIPTLPLTLMPSVIKTMPPEQLAKWNLRWERRGLYGGSAVQEFIPKWVSGDYLDPGFLADHPIPANRLTVTSGELVCDRYIHRGNSYEYSYQATADSVATIAVFYWPGWELLVDGGPSKNTPEAAEHGLVTLHLPAGRHLAELRYNLSPEGKTGRLVSLIAALIWVCLLGLDRSTALRNGGGGRRRILPTV